MNFQINEHGYKGYSMSNRAVSAYEAGEKPFSKWTKENILKGIKEFYPNLIKIAEKVPVAVLKEIFLYKSSWHHTSKMYNRTDFYSFNISIDITEEELLKRIADYKAQKEQEKKEKGTNVRYIADIEYLEWGGTRKYPKANVVKLNDVFVEDRGQWRYIYDIEGNYLFRKNVSTKGFRVLRNENKDIEKDFEHPQEQGIKNYADVDFDNFIYDGEEIPEYIKYSIKGITIKDGVTEIGEYAFSHCESLKSIEIPNSVIEIGKGAFYNCKSLKSITIPNSVTEIGISAFSYCINLKSIEIPNSVTEIGEYAFYNCKSLKSITIPDSVTEIRYRTFYICKSLKSITIPNGVTEIGDMTFSHCTNLESITIPDSVIKIGYNAFLNCENLTKAIIPDSVKEIHNLAFIDCPKLTLYTNNPLAVMIAEKYDIPYKSLSEYISESFSTKLRFKLVESLTEKFEQHDKLNSKIWGESKKLLPEIDAKLREVVKQYIIDSQFLKKSDIITVNVVGSNASYNYTKNSDIDIHLVVDMEKLSKDKKFAQFANDGEKSLFNKRYDIHLKGVEVDVYVEDIKATAVSNGVYDLYARKWVKEPVKIEAEIDEKAYTKKYMEVEKKAKELIKNGTKKEIEKFMNDLYKKRRDSLIRDGEIGDYNQIFKDLRAEGYRDKLNDRLADLTSEELSIE